MHWQTGIRRGVRQDGGDWTDGRTGQKRNGSFIGAEL